MAMQIGELLVRAKAMTAADLEEAVSWQVLYGGRLGTNMLELGVLEEKALAEALGKQLACEWTCGELELSESMVNMIPAVMARRHELVPWRIEGKRLKVLASAPGENLPLFDEIGFRTGKLVKAVVAPEFRIRQLLRRHFGSVQPMRALDFGVKPKGKRAQDADRKAEEKALEQAADLMDDDAFAAIYAEVMQHREQPKPAPAPAPPPPNVPAAAPAVARIQLVKAPPPVMVPVAPPEEEEILEGELLEDATLVEEDTEPQETTLDPAQAAVWASAFSELEAQMEQAPAPAPVDLSPLSFKEAVAEIGKADGRDAVARAVLRYARSKAARAVLLSIQGDVALGWDAVGEDLDPAVARTIVFPLTSPSAFRLVRESRSHYIGPLGKDAANVRFLKLAGKKWPSSAVLLPVLFRGRVVYILYVDNGHKQQVNPEVGELLILSQNISRSMEQMVAKRQVRA